MKIEKHLQDDHQARLTVEFDSDETESAKHRAARKLANRVRIPGFRPGKAPYAVIVRQVGDAAILEEAVELIIDEKYSVILDQSEIQPYGPGQLEKMAKVDPLTLEILVPLAGEVTLGDYHSLRQPYDLPQVTEKEVQDVLADLRERNAVSEPVERPAQQGDLVTIKLAAKRKIIEEGSESLLIRERSVPILIKLVQEEITEETDQRAEWPFPGFSRRLIGLSAQDEKTLDFTYPEDSSYENLRGVEGEFHFFIENVKERTLPELNDEFANSMGEYENLEALVTEIRSMLQSQKEKTYHNEYDDALLEEAAQQAGIKYPPQMLEREIEEMIHNLEDRLGQQGMSMDLYLKSRQMDMQAFEAEVRPSAETRLKKRLVLLEIAGVEKVQVEKEELQNETQETLKSLASMMDKKEVRKLSSETVYRNVMSNIMADLLTRRAMEVLRAIGSGKILSTQTEDARENIVDVEAQSIPAITPDAGEEMTESSPVSAEVQE